MDKYEIPILEYLYEALLDKGLFPANVGGWIKTYRVEDDLKISRTDLAKCLSSLLKRELIDSENNNFTTAQPLIKIRDDEGIEYLKNLKKKFIDAWHFKKKNKENAILARNWDKSGVDPHIRLKIEEGDDNAKKAIVYTKSNFAYSVWDILLPELVSEYSFYEYYENQILNEQENKGYLWLRGSGFWEITNIEKRDEVVIIFLKNVS